MSENFTIANTKGFYVAEEEAALEDGMWVLEEGLIISEEPVIIPEGDLDTTEENAKLQIEETPEQDEEDMSEVVEIMTSNQRMTCPSNCKI